MKIVTFDDIKRLNIDSQKAFEWVSYMIKNKDQTLLPSKTSMKPQENVFCNVMPSYINEKYGGVKVVTRYPNEIPALDSQLLLFNAQTGEKLALMDANWITAMRTGAVAVHSINLFAKKDYKTIGILGLGNTARSTIQVLLDLNPDREFYIKLLRYKNQAELFMERFKDYDNVKFEIVETNVDLVKDSDVIISCATVLNEDICPDEYFKEGVLVVPVHTRGFSNCDLFFDKVYADDYGHVHHFKYFDKFKYFSEVCDVVNGRKLGRENESERIIAYNIGISIHDIYYASQIYEMIKDDDSIHSFDMKSPTDKFWF